MAFQRTKQVTESEKGQRSITTSQQGQEGSSTGTRSQSTTSSGSKEQAQAGNSTGQTTQTNSSATTAGARTDTNTAQAIQRFSLSFALRIDIDTPVRPDDLPAPSSNC